MDKSIKTIDQYIAQFPPDVQQTLQQMRQIIQAAVPEATEKISYGLCTFVFHGNLVHFGAYDTHYGFYPGAGPIVDFAKELRTYETSKGTVRFPISQPVPFDLITKMTRAATERNLQKRR